MANNQANRRKRDIKTKLMAAVSMLLVSSIMMVSSTYAWFTLSTAPEVKGITTAVGANGNLEMALLPKNAETDDITSAAGDSLLDSEARNVTWGNLVDLSDTSVYGLDKITLFPSALNVDAAGKLNTTTMLKTPTYGADGRVSELAENTVTSYFDKTERDFMPNDDYGVRAVGTASGMTPRQLDYRNAQAAANTATAQAKNAASASLNTNGSTLANIAIQRATDSTATYNQDDVDALNAIVNDLLGYTPTGGKHVTGALEYIETAYMQYILAYAASSDTGIADTAYNAVKALVEKENATLATVKAGLSTANVALPEALATAITAYETTVANVKSAQSALNDLSGDSIAWADISVPLHKLADTDSMKVNDIPVSEIKDDDNMSNLLNSVAAGGLNVTMASGGGVYADIADHCGDYSASVVIEQVNYGGLTLNNMNAKMSTASTVKPAYLKAISGVVANKRPDVTGDASMPITDMYGYVIDLAFRTNAAESNLLLQVDAADRIYNDNTNEETMGGGSSMTFASTTSDFSNDNVKNLMSAIRMVFFHPTQGTIYVNGKLDVANAKVGSDGVTAEIQLYKGDANSATGKTWQKVTGSAGTHKQEITYVQLTGDALQAWTGDLYTKSTADGDTYVKTNTKENENGTYKQVVNYVALTAEEKNTYSGDRYMEVTGVELVQDNKILPLVQNQATALSVLVYLDGNNMGNDDVAATAATSMTGKMNIQFASSANLVPMEYANLHQGTGSGTGTGNTSATAMTAVTAAANTYKISSATFTDKTIAVKLADSSDAAITTGTVAFTVAGNNTPYTATYANGVWSATVTETLAANTAVTVTYTAVT